MNTITVIELPSCTTLSHGPRDKVHRRHRILVNGEILDEFSEDTQKTDYRTGVGYDNLVKERVGDLEKALKCEAEWSNQSHWTDDLRLKILELLHGNMSIEELEWSGTQRGQGSGPHSSGGDGPLFAACPVCGGLREPNGHFIDDAVGHRPDCELNKLLTGDK